MLCEYIKCKQDAVGTFTYTNNDNQSVNISAEMCEKHALLMAKLNDKLETDKYNKLMKRIDSPEKNIQ